MAQWYQEGLIDKDFYTRNNNFIPDTSLTTTGVAAVAKNQGTTGLFHYIRKRVVV